MAIALDKLPKIITLEEYGGNYQAYIDAIYDVFFRDFIQHKATFGTNKLNLRFKPLQQNRAYAFYHMTHVGEDEDNRLPDLRRCERMPWARPTIEQAEEMGLKFWEQDRRNGRRICIWLEAENNEVMFYLNNLELHNNDELVEFPYGFHTTVYTPGYQTYFLWLMAGDYQGFNRSNDPEHAWVE